MARFVAIGVTGALGGFFLVVFYASQNPIALFAGLAILVLAGLLVRGKRVV